MLARAVLSTIDDTGRNLAQWLREVARGKPAVEASLPAESSDVVLGHLEARTGRTLRSRAAVDALLKDMAQAEYRTQVRGMRRGILRGALLLTLLLAAVLHYYYWDVTLEIGALPRVEVYGVAPPPPTKR
jgi:hypothetical protein